MKFGSLKVSTRHVPSKTATKWPTWTRVFLCSAECFGDVQKWIRIIIIIVVVYFGKAKYPDLKNRLCIFMRPMFQRGWLHDSEGLTSWFRGVEFMIQRRWVHDSEGLTSWYQVDTSDANSCQHLEKKKIRQNMFITKLTSNFCQGVKINFISLLMT